MRLIALLLSLVLLACGDSPPPLEPPEDYAGTYEMIAINGAPLPFLLLEDDDGDTVEVISGAVVLRADQSFEDRAMLRFTEAGVALPDEADVITGTFTVTGGRVRFTTSEGFTYEAVVAGDVMTQTFDGIILTYRR